MNLSLQTEFIRRTSSLGIKLLVAWSCGLGWGIGSTVLNSGLLLYTYEFQHGLVGFLVLVDWKVSLLLVIVSPALLGWWLARRRRGLLSGLITSPVNVITPLNWGIATVAAYALFWSPLWRLFNYTLLERIVDWGPSLLAQGITATVVIALVLLGNTPAFPHRRRGLGYGAMVGAVLSLASCLGLIVLRDHLLPFLTQPPYWDQYLWLSFYLRSALFYFLWQMPALIWVSTVYVLEITRQPAGWLGLVLWLVLVLATFGMPFIFDRLWVISFFLLGGG